MKTFKTEKGLELLLMNLQGKDYLAVQQRVIWFRSEHPDWSIETEVTLLPNDRAIAKAIIRDPKGQVLATGHKLESHKDFPAGYIEKAESGAIGRALALVGYGTQFAVEMEEGERIVDSPVAPRGFEHTGSAPSGSDDPGEFVFTMKKFKGQKLKDIQTHELRNYADFLERSAVTEGKPPGPMASELISAINAHLNEDDKTL